IRAPGPSITSQEPFRSTPSARFQTLPPGRTRGARAAIASAAAAAKAPESFATPSPTPPYFFRVGSTPSAPWNRSLAIEIPLELDPHGVGVRVERVADGLVLRDIDRHSRALVQPVPHGRAVPELVEVEQDRVQPVALLARVRRERESRRARWHPDPALLDRPERKSTRLELQSRENLVCRLLLEKKKEI